MNDKDRDTIETIARTLFDEIRKEGKHFCLHDEDFGDFRASFKRIDEKLDAKAERDEKILAELISAKNEYGNRITALENTGKVIGAVFGIFIIAWTAGKLIFK